MYPRYIKRLLDLLLALVALPFVLAVIGVCAVFIYAEDQGPVFYLAKRMGKQAKPFTMYKLRTMKVDAPDLRQADGSTYNAQDDDRQTRVGRILRTTSIDELPQIFNIFKGEMSFIGPRPDDLEEARHYQGDEARKLEVLPGITGYAQVSGRNAISWHERLALDIEYVEKVSFAFDLRILAKTFTTVVMREGVYVANDGADGQADGDGAGLAETDQAGHGRRGFTDKVSLVVVAYNEQDYLPGLIEDIYAQDYPHELIEVILVDSNCGQNEAQRGIMDEMASKKHQYADVRVFDNPKTKLPAGCNVALAAYTGDVFVRVDAHARIPNDFVRMNIEVLNEGKPVCGGYRPVVVKDQNPWSETMLAAETSAFGSSASAYRRPMAARSVSSVFHAAYRREVIDKVGLYDERLQRTEDNDYNWRVRAAGFEISYDPRISSRQYLRSDFKGLVRQKAANGFWVGRTMWIRPQVFSILHFVPLCFVLALLATVLLGLFSHWLALALLLAAYLACDLVASIIAIAKANPPHWQMACLPIVFFILHLAYGLGTLAGLISGCVALVGDQAKPRADQG